MSPHTRYRLLELIPGFLDWSTFVIVGLLTVWRPLWMVYFIVLFDFYWMVKVLYLTTYLLIAYRRYHNASRVNWLERAERHTPFRDLVHLIFVPNSTETEAVIRTTFDCLLASHYPLDRMIVVLATEQRSAEIGRRNAEFVRANYGNRFLQLIHCEHPANIPGELAGKGANLHFAFRQVQPELAHHQLDPKQIIVTTLDADTCVHPEYFAYLSEQYLTVDHPTRTSFQPIPLFNNNIWDAPPVMRVAARGTTFWLMSELMRPERLWTFSSHSMSYQALTDVGGWQSDVVSDDSRIFLQCFLEYDGDYRVHPMYLPLNMDTVVGEHWWGSIKNLYKQQRRWAYGAENIPFIIWHFAKAKRIPKWTRLRLTFNQLEGMWSWATNPLLILVLGYVPFFLLPAEAEALVFSQNAPQLLAYLLTVSNVGLLVSMILGTILLPARPRHVPKWKIIFMIGQWIFLPVSMIVFGSIPALEAHTRLMLGKYLGFYVTDKPRRN